MSVDSDIAAAIWPAIVSDPRLIVRGRRGANERNAAHTENPSDCSSSLPLGLLGNFSPDFVNRTGNRGRAMKKVAIYLRVSTDSQTTDNQRRELEAVAARSGWQMVKV